MVSAAAHHSEFFPWVFLGFAAVNEPQLGRGKFSILQHSLKSQILPLSWI